MRAMVLDTTRTPLRSAELPDPDPGPGRVLLRVRACGVCRTDLHVVDGELPKPGFGFRHRFDGHEHPFERRARSV